MRNAALAVGVIMTLIGLYLMSAVVAAREIRDAELNNLFYGFILAVVGIVVAFVARIFIWQRD